MKELARHCFNCINYEECLAYEKRSWETENIVHNQENAMNCDRYEQRE